MKHIVSLSGGTSSAVAANRVINRYGKENVILWFADTLWEDEDLYRFLEDLELLWDIPIVRSSDGRTPLEVAYDDEIIPNSRVATCSKALKIIPFRYFLETVDRPVTVHLGLDWTEEHRMVSPKREYEKIEGVTVDFPLLWKPYANPPHRMETESWGIKTPCLYDMGFSHNNCGGRCVRQGQSTWERLKTFFPERFNEVRDWEEDQIERFPHLKGRGIIKSGDKGKTLKEYENQYMKGQQGVLEMFPSMEDTYACVCDY